METEFIIKKSASPARENNRTLGEWWEQTTRKEKFERSLEFTIAKVNLMLLVALKYASIFFVRQPFYSSSIAFN